MSLVEDGRPSVEKSTATAATPRRRRGRPTALPQDRSDPSGRYYDLWARTSWLLATCRTLGSGLVFAERSTFVDALTVAGVSADLSRVSRWESGQQPIPVATLTAYEQTLGLPPGAVVSAHRQLARSAQPGTPRPDRVLVRGRVDRAPDAIIGDLLARAIEGETLTGGDWLALATELEHFELVLLKPDDWATICNRLVNELARTASVDHVRRYEALTTLLGHPVAQRHVRRSLGLWLTTDDVQVVTPMLSLLQHLADPAANTLVLRMLDSDRRLLRQGAIQVIAAKLAREHITEPAGLALVEQHALRAVLTASGRRSVDLLDLTSHLPATTLSRVLTAIKDPGTRLHIQTVHESRFLTPPETARSVSRSIATQVQSMTPSRYVAEPDQMLQRLVMEALFHVSAMRRQLAAHLLGLSPYGDAVAECCITMATSDREAFGERAWEAVWMLGSVPRLSDLAALARDDHAWTQRRALIAMARSPIPLTPEQQVACVTALTSRHDKVRSAALYAVGMHAPEHLPAAPSKSAPSRRKDPPHATGDVTWWRQVGPALRDPDSHPVLGASAS